MTTTKLETFRAMAEAYLRDAQREQNSERTRVDCAFDAVYMYCRCVLAGADEGREHPDVSVLQDAAAALGWRVEAMAVALAYHRRRLEPACQARYSQLVALALRLKEKAPG